MLIFKCHFTDHNGVIEDDLSMLDFYPYFKNCITNQFQE